MGEGSELLKDVIGWLPLLLIFGVWVLFMRGAVKRHGAMKTAGEENTAAVRENTAVLKAILEKLNERPTSSDH